jgi:hypothetical protein
MAMPPPPGAGTAPGGLPPGLGQPQLPAGGPANAAPPGGAPALLGAPGGLPPAPGAPPAPSAQGPSPANASAFSDLSAKMPHAYQLLDAAERTITMAIETGGFYKQPDVLAGVRKLSSDLRKIIQGYAKSGDSDGIARPANYSDGAGYDASPFGGGNSNEGEDDNPPELDEP